MPALSKHQSNATTKLLFVGDSGGGKTGALASLSVAGYNLRIVDTDNGLDVLRNLLTDPQSPYVKADPSAVDRVQYVTLTNPKKNINGKLIPSGATVWPRLAQLLAHWKDGEVDLGPITTWTPQEVLVIDTLTTVSTAALDFILSMNGRLGQRPQLQDWGAGQDLVEQLLQMLYDDSVKCNVIVNCHITYIGEENGPLRGYPNTLGKALPPKVGRYFNSILMTKTTGSGSAMRRKILTNTSGVVELKNTAPMRVKAEYPLESGLADYFMAVREQGAVK